MLITIENHTCEFSNNNLYGSCDWHFIHEIGDEFNIETENVEAWNWNDHRITLDDNQLWELREAIIEKVSDMMLWEEYLEEQREWNDYLNHDDERY